MTDYYNTEGVNTKALEHFIAELEAKRRSKRRDAVLLVFLGIFGLSGFLLVFNPSRNANFITNQVKDDKHSGLYADTNAELSQSTTDVKAVKVNQSPVQTADITTAKPLIMQGEFRKNAVIEFTINAFNSDATYELDLGNGSKLTTTQQKVTFTYDRAGHYIITLNAMKNGQPEFQYKEQLIIEE
ncbi:MAG: PKD domain-containing protein [Saprospiraceae bacterium]|nr:PKD domain-containing protein [Saprospiraceae bacterium]